MSIPKEVAAEAAEQHDKVTFKVSLDDSGRQLDLVYRKGQNPVDAAKHFLAQNNLSISYLNGIVDQIKTHNPETKNFEQYKSAKPVVLKPVYDKYKRTPDLKGLQGSAYADPSTGGVRYVPGQTASSSEDYGDPFTSGGRYIPGQSASNTSVGGGDPYTSGGRYISNQDTTDLVLIASLLELMNRIVNELMYQNEEMKKKIFLNEERRQQRKKDVRIQRRVLFCVSTFVGFVITRLGIWKFIWKSFGF
ncbi:unnamed protein product [Bursaphelenchus okinawaensis]|uniref:PFU domain-containing protein n=1 Tax=Bursaphelenchus okinawaensis TaxID=465554 RepID=A0A811KAL6_9BILA|nr:unnamed protein product [Bursaphelenchus okinawaensis]CAG9099351.1 unnamed protein product [Bursaphelenchus okinawaensis]